MALTYTCEREVIEMALEKLKIDGLVSKESYFNFEAPGGLRKEVAYRDFDFLTRLSRTAEIETAASILVWLKDMGIAAVDGGFDWEVFEVFNSEVKDNFSMPGTSISPVMERLLYMLSSLKQPQRAVGIGTYCGYGLVWAIGASCGERREYYARNVYGIDIDEDATRKARDNFKRLANTDHVELIADDGLIAADRLDGPFDYVYLDVDSRELGKGLYLYLLKRLYGKIKKGGWVLAHDTTASPFAEQLEAYLAYVRDGSQFERSISFDIDPYGLELSIK
jgi:predicted O-methyltransferase YrrM